jgi:hypothetical protein
LPHKKNKERRRHRNRARYHHAWTLDELDPPAWGPPPEDATGLMLRVHALRLKEVEKFSDEDFRLAIGQEIALQHLMPLAIGRLEANPLVEGDCYQGDVLNAVLTVEEAFWSEHPDLKLKVDQVLDRVDQLPERDEFDKFQTDAIECFRAL